MYARVKGLPTVPLKSPGVYQTFAKFAVACAAAFGVFILIFLFV